MKAPGLISHRQGTTSQWTQDSGWRHLTTGTKGTSVGPAVSLPLFSPLLSPPPCLCLSLFSLLSFSPLLSLFPLCSLSLYFFLSLPSLFLFFPLFLSVPEEKKGGRERRRVGREDRSAGSSPLSAFSLKSIPECVRCSFSSVERSSWAGVSPGTQSWKLSPVSEDLHDEHRQMRQAATCALAHQLSE